MSCPTCDHTMECFGSLGNFWCPRCGTIVNPAGEVRGVPRLVERCRAYGQSGAMTGGNSPWHRLGIAESINKPGERS